MNLKRTGREKESSHLSLHHLEMFEMRAVVLCRYCSDMCRHCMLYFFQREVIIMSRNKRVTIADVARTANVSRALVSFVLNGRLKDVAPATRVRIQQAIDELGYRPDAIARNLETKRAGATRSRSRRSPLIPGPLKQCRVKLHSGCQYTLSASSIWALC
jgi:hypothetical protein